MRIDFRDTMPSATRNIIILNVIVLLAEWVLPRIGIDLVDLLGMHYIGSDRFGFHQLITYMFLHDPSGFSHLFFNMFALFMFGGILERVWGQKRFVIYYLATGVGAGLVQQLTWYLTSDPATLHYYADFMITIGASGAVFGVLLAFGMLFPNIPLYIMFIPIPVKAKWVVIGYGLIELFAGIRGSADGVAHFAHLGGMLFGIIFILLWRRKERSKDAWQEF